MKLLLLALVLTGCVESHRDRFPDSELKCINERLYDKLPAKDIWILHLTRLGNTVSCFGSEDLAP